MLRISGWTDWKLELCRIWVVGYGLWVMGCGLWGLGCGSWVVVGVILLSPWTTSSERTRIHNYHQVLTSALQICLVSSLLKRSLRFWIPFHQHIKPWICPLHMLQLTSVRSSLSLWQMWQGLSRTVPLKVVTLTLCHLTSRNGILPAQPTHHIYW